jgi:hypothetical protein
MPAVPNRKGGIEKKMGRGLLKLSPIHLAVQEQF